MLSCLLNDACRRRPIRRGTCIDPIRRNSPVVFLACISRVLTTRGFAQTATGAAPEKLSMTSNESSSSAGVLTPDTAPATTASDNESEFTAEAVNSTGTVTSDPLTTVNLTSFVSAEPLIGTAIVQNKMVRPSLPTTCIPFSATLCRAVHDRSILALTITQTALLLSDGITTKRSIERGYIEVDPITRTVLGRKPTWSRMAPLGTVRAAAEALSSRNE